MTGETKPMGIRVWAGAGIVLLAIFLAVWRHAG